MFEKLLNMAFSEIHSFFVHRWTFCQGCPPCQSPKTRLILDIFLCCRPSVVSSPGSDSIGRWHMWVPAMRSHVKLSNPNLALFNKSTGAILNKGQFIIYSFPPVFVALVSNPSSRTRVFIYFSQSNTNKFAGWNNIWYGFFTRT